MPGGTEEQYHRSGWHHRRDTLFGMGNPLRSPPMTARRDPRCSVLCGELRQGQNEEHLELGMGLRNRINDVISMERLGRFPRANLDGLRSGELVEGAVRLQDTVTDTH